MNTILINPTDAPLIVDKIRDYLRKYLIKSNLKALILGESGGIDSALVSALVRPVCDELQVTLVGRSITIETNTVEERSRAQLIGEAFCHDFREVDLTTLFYASRDAVEEGPLEPLDSRAYRLRVGNIKARLRMIYLYNLAQMHRGLVLSTDNQTEWQLGFWTLHGDVGDLDPLFGLWKSEVYTVAKYLIDTFSPDSIQYIALRACCDALPTDGLGISSTDVEQLGAADYSEVDAALLAYIDRQENTINQSVVDRHKASAFKRLNPIFIDRQELGI